MVLLETWLCFMNDEEKEMAEASGITRMAMYARSTR